MDQGGVIALLIGAIVAVAIVGGPRILDALGAPARRRRGREFLRNAAGGRPPMSAADVEDLQRWLAQETLPCAGLIVGDAPPLSDQTSRLGGPAWLPAGEAWPIGGNGNAMTLVVQINFAEVPPLADFPGRGLLLIFVADDDVHGLTWKEQEHDDIRVLYIPDLSVPGVVVRRPGPPPENSPFQKTEVESEGRSVRFVAGAMAPSGGDWRTDHKWPAWWARDGDGRFQELLERDEDEPEHRIYLGGQPYFIHGTDIREPGRFEEFDRVLLQANSDENIMWGDVGGATFMIRRADLLSRDFRRVLFTWDSC